VEANLALRADPLNTAARILRGKALLAEGDAARAVTYLLAAVERQNTDPDLWFTLAGALRQNQQVSEAVQALEASLRLDRSRIDGWWMLFELAENGGATEIAEEALGVLRAIAPDDPRVQAIG
jgi:predicted Zn-dependent protease